MEYERHDDDQDNQKLTLDAEMNKLAKETLENFDFMKESILKKKIKNTFLKFFQYLIF